MDFDVGDVVVCVDAKPNWPDYPPCCAAYARLREGATYRVCGIRSDYKGNVGIDVGVRNNDILDGLNDVYPPWRFRKIPKADDTFTAEMRALRPHREKIPA